MPFSRLFKEERAQEAFGSLISDGCVEPSLPKPGERRASAAFIQLFLDPIKMSLCPDDQGSLDNRRGGKTSVVQLVAGDDIETVAGLNDVAGPVLIKEIQVTPRVYW